MSKAIIDALFTGHDVSYYTPGCRYIAFTVFKLLYSSLAERFVLEPLLDCVLACITPEALYLSMLHLSRA